MEHFLDLYPYVPPEMMHIPLFSRLAFDINSITAVLSPF